MQKKTAILTNEKTSITTAHSSGANNLAIMIDQARAYNMVPIIATITPDQRGIDKDIEYRNNIS